MVNSLRLVCDLHVSGWSGHGKEQTANTKRNTKSKATTAMKTTKFFFLTANDNHSPFIFANQNLLKCCEFAPPPRALSPVLEMN